MFNLCITNYCNISKGKIYANDKLIFESIVADFESFSSELYKKLELNYSKFHKMDNLAKLGWLASELVIKNVHFNCDPYKFAINIMNCDSSIDTDICYQNIIDNNKSSPSIFVYTLPNIMIGEICIKNNIKGDNLLQISETFDIPSQYNYMHSLFEAGIVEKSICGWVNFNKNNYEAFLYIVEKVRVADSLPFNIETINKLYKKRLNEF
ncbi:MAG: 3-oxoacyl-ACP synthase [Bacteroidetes bacterium]|nr:3-oxoacyl-ACP synthase [Bacteroidota bacterium]